MSETSIEIHALNLFYGDFQALTDISLDIPAAAARAPCCAFSTA
jgi:ABC-type arginine transport system ATPase subunit